MCHLKKKVRTFGVLCQRVQSDISSLKMFIAAEAEHLRVWHLGSAASRLNYTRYE